MLNEKSAGNANRPLYLWKLYLKNTSHYKMISSCSTHISSKCLVARSGLVPTFIGIPRVPRKVCVSFSRRIIGLQRALAVAESRKEISEITKGCFQRDASHSLWPALCIVEASSDDSSTRSTEYKNVLRFLQMNFFPIDKSCPGKTAVSSWLLQNPRGYFHRRMQRLSHLEQFWEAPKIDVSCLLMLLRSILSLSVGIINLNCSSSVLNSLRHHLQYNLPLKFYYAKLRS